MKNKKICPWCGKSICVNKAGMKRVKTNLTLVHCCPNCSGVASSWTTSVFWTLIIAFAVFMYINRNVVLVLMIFLPIMVIYFFALSLISPKLYRIGLDGKRNKEQLDIFIGFIDTDRDFCLHKGEILLTDKEIENAEAFSVSAPIRIINYRKSSKAIKFEFLYSNEKTVDLLKSGSINVYSNENGEPISIIVPQ